MATEYVLRIFRGSVATSYVLLNEDSNMSKNHKSEQTDSDGNHELPGLTYTRTYFKRGWFSFLLTFLSSERILCFSANPKRRYLTRPYEDITSQSTSDSLLNKELIVEQLPPELQGRIGQILVLEPLSEEDYYRILKIIATLLPQDSLENMDLIFPSPTRNTMRLLMRFMYHVPKYEV